jgi:predicted GIY-YIG superfamily endonuclease
MPRPLKIPSWFVYLLRCRDGSLYCGITKDIPRRVDQHNSGAGAKYVVPARRPVECVWKRRMANQSRALGLEYWLKQQSAETKGRLVEKRARLTSGKAGWKISPPRG